MKKVALVTGASRGLGASLAIEFARAGYRVALNYRSNGAHAARVVRKIESERGEAIGCQADVRTASDVEAMVKNLIERWGRIDVLVNNAGVTHEALLVSVTEADWDRVMDTNLKGAFNCSKAVGKHMLRQRSGQIVNVCSILGVRGARGESAYAASKAALIGFTMSLARELGTFGVSVNAVMPGFMRTSMTRAATEEAKRAARRDNVLDRFSDPTSAARFIVHLADMKTVSGQVFNLDGRIHRWM
ncbi:MAG: 3-oxoacyl-ACP reductase FabG [bacterium]